MKTNFRIVISALVAVLVAGAAGCATSSSPADAARIANNASKPSTLDKACVENTGSRIKPAKGEEAKKGANCMQPGTTYSKDELDQTGEIDTGRALRQLDPRIQ